jgi:DMSO/TMAO reductase YedYZ molybdopterin-dependent catalytic subunit
MAIDNEKLTAEQEIARRTRRSFMVLGGGAAVGMAGLVWMNSGTPEEGDIPGPLRSMLGFNERVVRDALYSNQHLVKTFPASAIGKIKANGHEGLDDDVEDNQWRLDVVPFASTHTGSTHTGSGDAGPGKLQLADVQTLPRHEETIDFKCVEGWSTVTQFAGARFSDFTAKFSPGSEKAAWVGMKTPDEGYYVALDMPSALHPQTLLAWEMNGAPLAPEHGFPLRLVIPVKYGIKNIKRIGRIEYTNARPADYWAERGYDWYAGL